MPETNSLTVDNYWNNLIDDPDIAGVSAMGGCGIVEIYYRTYFEAKRFQTFLRPAFQTILEVGCGSGRWALQIGKNFETYVGIDISAKSIQKADEITRAQNISNCSFQVVKPEEFHSSIKFDVIYFSGVSQYMEDDELRRTIHHLKQYLHPHGILIDRSTITMEAKRRVNNNEGYYSIYRNAAEVHQLISGNDFKLIASKDSYLFLRIGRLARYINNSPAILKLIRYMSPVSFYCFHWITQIRQMLKPYVFEEPEAGRFTHKFHVFSIN